MRVRKKYVHSYKAQKLRERTSRAQGYIRIDLRARVDSLEQILDLLRWEAHDLRQENHELKHKLARRWWRRGG